MSLVDPFTAIEDGTVAAIKAATEGKVKAVDNAPPNWSPDMLNRVMLATPAIFVAITGAPNPAPGGDVAQLSPKVSVIIGIESGANEPASRRGDGTVIGVYPLFFTLLPKLHGLAIDGVGELQFLGFESVDVTDWDVQGLALYEMSFEVTDLQVKDEDATDLSTFETLDLSWKNPGDAGPDGQTIAQDDLTIPT